MPHNAVPAHRTAEAQIIITGQDNRPLANQPVTVRQTGHAFLFGCGFFRLKPDDHSPEQKLYRDRWLALHNYATLPFYWGSYERQPGQTREPRLRAMVEWTRDRDVTMKGHPLCWHTASPKWYTDYSLEEIWRMQLDRITREVSGFAGLVDMWDVVNEACIMPDFDRRENPLTPLCRKMGRVEIIRQTFERARAANPDATLLLNDYNQTEKFAELIEQCLDAGIDIDVIGIQSHMHRSYVRDEAIHEVCERFARFGKPLHWTEATIISGRIIPDLDYHVKQEHWPTTPEGEHRQAEEVESFYRTLWNHPAVEAVTWWNMLDNQWLNAPAGLVRPDLSPKPAYERLQQLIKNEWWTPEQTLTTDDTGTIHVQGVKGRYEVAADGGTGEFTLDDRTETVTITMQS